MIDSDEQAQWEQALEDGTFEEAQAALEAVVARLEAGNLPLSESIASFVLGVRLADRCEKMLAEAELVIETLALPDESAEPDDAERPPRIVDLMPDGEFPF
jgi:exodeoxyribonuclease VII small subunit